MESNELRRKIPASLWGNYKSFVSHSDTILRLLHWPRILSLISTFFFAWASASLWEEGGHSWALTKGLIHKPAAAPFATSPSTPEATMPWQEKLAHQTNSRFPLQQLFPDNTTSALPGTVLPLTQTCTVLLSSSETLGRSYRKLSASTVLAYVLLFIKKTLLHSKKVSQMKLKDSDTTSPVFLGLHH